MLSSRLSGSMVSSGLRNRSEWSKFCSSPQTKVCSLKGVGSSDGLRSWQLHTEHRNLLSPLRHRNLHLSVVLSQLTPEYGVDAAEVGENLALRDDVDAAPVGLTENVDEIKEKTKDVPVDVKKELARLALPAILGQAIDPFAQLMETAYIGRLSAVALASAGVSISVFNIVSKLFNIPLLSVATSFVAEDIAKNADRMALSGQNGKPVKTERTQLSSVSTALVLAVFIGIFEALALSLGSGPFLSFMGVPPVLVIS